MTRKIILAFSVLLVAVVATLFAVSPAEAEPTVKWNPKKVEETLQPGQSRVIETSFTALSDVPSAVLRVATSIAPYVTAQPATIEPVSKGQTIPVTLTVNIPIDALPATTSGAVQLRVGEPHGKKEFGKTIARPLPVDVCVEWPTLSDPRLPYVLRYPATWASSIDAEEIVRLIGQVATTVSTKPGDMGGLCKVVIRPNQNPEALSLPLWVQQIRADGGAPLPSSSATRNVSGLPGLQEITEEIGITTTVYLAPSPTEVASFQLLCGDDASEQGQAIFNAILESVAF